MALSMATIRGAEVVFKSIVEHSTVVQAIRRAIHIDSLNEVSLLERQKALESNINEMTGGNLTNLEARLTKLQLLKYKGYDADLKGLAVQRQFLHVFDSIGKAQVAAFGIMVGLAGDLALKSKLLNQNLIEANSAYQTRWGLMHDTLFLQLKTGVSFEKATESARALVGYGMDTESTYSENLRIVTQMEQGLAVSVQTSAMLASVVERQVKGSFSAVADVVAQLVNDTSLAGEEAAKLATHISQAMGRLHPGTGAVALPEVVKLVGRYESALKEVSGSAGGFQELVTKLTTSEGLAGAGALGVNPDFLQSERGVQTVMDRFAQFGNRMVGMTSGWERQMRLEMLGQMFGLSAEQANQMLIAIRRVHNQTVTDITLQERWRQQMASVDKGIERLYNSLIALAQGALYPVVWAVNGVVNRLADVAGWILSHQAIAVGAMVVLGVGMIGIIASMVSLGAALWFVVRTSDIATAALARLSAVQTESLAGGGGGATGAVGAMGLLGMLRSSFVTWGKGLGGFVSAVKDLGLMASVRGLGLSTLVRDFAGLLVSGPFAFLRPLMWLPRLVVGIGLIPSLIVSAIAGAVFVLWKIHAINKQSAEDQENARKIILSKQDLIDAKLQENFYAAVRYGTAGDVKAQKEAIYRDALAKFSQIGDVKERTVQIEQWIKYIQTILPEAVARGILSGSQFKTVAQMTPAEIQRNKDILEASQQGNVDRRKLVIEAAKAAAHREQVEQDRQTEEAKRNSHWYSDWYRSGSTADIVHRVY